MRLASVLDAASEAMLVVAQNGDVLFFNKACERLFGYAATEILGRSVSVLMPPPVADQLALGCADYFRAAQADGEAAFRHRDGSVFKGELSFATASSPQGDQHLMIVRAPHAGEDGDSRLAELQSDLMRTARMSAMEEMSGVLAHKLNQPLTAVILYLQAIERAYGRETAGGPLPERVVTILEKAVREAERASSMLQRMRQFREQRESVPRPVDLNQVVDDAVEMTTLFCRPGMQITRLLTPRLPPVTVDPVQLQQALVSLIRAAIAAVRAGGSAGIRVATHRFRDDVAVVVDLNDFADQGKPANGAAVSPTLGAIREKDLAMSRAIAQNQGGELHIDTDGHDRGTRLTLRLPLSARAAAPSA